MKLEKYTGYNVTLYTALSVRECRRRLQAEFSYPRRMPNQAASDKNLSGGSVGQGFVIRLWRVQLERTVLWGDALVEGRAFTVRLFPSDGGTRIAGSYGYEHGAGMLLGSIVMLCLALVAGVLLLILGIISVVQGGGGTWLLGVGVLILAGVAAFLTYSDDRQFLRERDYIVRYLERVLEARKSDS